MPWGPLAWGIPPLAAPTCVYFFVLRLAMMLVVGDDVWFATGSTAAENERETEREARDGNFSNKLSLVGL